MSADPRYVAVVKIIEVKDDEIVTEYNREKITPGYKRELMDIEIRSRTLDSLQSKIKAHIDLVEELS